AQLRDIRSAPFAGTGGYRGDARFTHRLISRRMLEIYNSTGDHLSGLRRRYPYNPAFLHPDDLSRIGVRPGEVVRIDSDHDFIYGVAEASVDLRPRVVSMAHAHRDRPQHDGRGRTIGRTPGRGVRREHGFHPRPGLPRQ